MRKILQTMFAVAARFFSCFCCDRVQGRRQKNFQRRGSTEKRLKNSKKRSKNSSINLFRGKANRKKIGKIAKKIENSTIKPLSTIFVLCIKIQGGHDPPLSTPMIVVAKMKKLAAGRTSSSGETRENLARKSYCVSSFVSWRFTG